MQSVSLAREFDSLLYTNEPCSDDDLDDTAARFGSRESAQDDNDVEQSSRSKLRDRLDNDLHLQDPKYSGKVVDRKDVFSSDEDHSSGDEKFDDDDIVSDEDISEDDGVGEETSHDDGSEVSDEGETVIDRVDDNATQSQGFLLKSTGDSKVQAVSIRKQFTLWDKLMAVRIRLQSVMLLINKLDVGYKIDLKAREVLKKSLVDLLEVEKQLTEKLKQCSDVPNVGKNDDNEEITSSEDEKEKEEGKKEKPLKRKLLDGFQDEIVKRCKDNTEIRDAIINKWDGRTRLSVTKNKHDFSAFENGAVNQIKKVLEQKSRLITRTQVDRNNRDEQSQKVLNPELFDDSDFYEQLLRELIETKANLSNDPSESARNCELLRQLQKKKKKRAVDTKASKARKMKYTVHNKLVNFIAPYDNCNWTENATNYLFESLFAK